MQRNSEKLVYTPQSLLDTDLYQFTVQQAIMHHFADSRPGTLMYYSLADASISFTRFRNLRLTSEEKIWLASTCPYFSKEYLEYLSEFRFDPAQISIAFIPVSDDDDEGKVEIEASGLWREAILWEAQALLQAGCSFNEFGIQRRRSFYAQDLVIATLKRETDRSPRREFFFGTSNGYFAKKYGIHPVGTVAHEWFMGVAALKGYQGANAKALSLWQETYPNDSFVALTDTFSTKVFFEVFAKDLACAEKWTGLKQDSGNPFEFAPAAKAMYESIGIDICTNTIIYSDALTLDKVLQLKKQCDDIGFRRSFGMGTFLTNDFKTKSSGYTEKSRALNMVIKLAKVDDRDCVKITDDPSKNTGDRASVDLVKRLYGLPN